MLYLEVEVEGSFTFEDLQHVRGLLARHTEYVNAANPNWRTLFTG